MKPECKASGTYYKYDLSPLMIVFRSLCNMKTIMSMFLSISQLCHILTSKLERTPETPMWAERGKNEQTLHYGLWPQVVSNTQNPLKYRETFCMCMSLVCQWEKRDCTLCGRTEKISTAPLCARTHLFTSLKCLCVALATFPIISPFLCQGSSL